MFRFNLVLTAILMTSCGLSHVERLAGEPEQAHHFTADSSKRIHPAVDGLERFRRHIQQGEFEHAFMHLSGQTRQMLRGEAKKSGLSAIEFLAARSPRTKGVERLFRDPIAFFVIDDLVKAHVKREAATGKGLQQVVVVTNRQGKTRGVMMRFEGIKWRIHRPTP